MDTDFAEDPPLEAQSLPVVYASETAQLMDVISRAAADPSVDVDKLERLLAMRKEIAAEAAERAFNEAMRTAQAAMPAVLRNAENSQTSSRYATLEAVADAIDPVIHSNGFSPSFGTADSTLPGHYRVTCTLSHVAGHKRDYFADVPSDMNGMKGNQNKTATHAFGSTMSYGRRYLKLLIFDVKLTDRRDDDGNAAGGDEPINQAQLDTLRALIVEVDADIPRFLKFMRVDALEDIPVRNLNRALVSLEAKKTASAKANA